MDPRRYGPQERKANLSELMQAKGKASAGEAVNACPFGCQDEELDELGYCQHLVGFTNDGKMMEPMVPDERGRRRCLGSAPEPVKKSDKLVRITVSSRVYRDVEEQK